MAQLTPRIRLYSSDCNQTAMVVRIDFLHLVLSLDLASQFEAIKQLKVNLKVFIGISVAENADADYTSQRDAVISVLQTYGTDGVLGVTVGNEFMLKFVPVSR